MRVGPQAWAQPTRGEQTPSLGFADSGGCMREVARKLGGMSVLVVWWVCALLTTGCLESHAVTCKNGLICGPGNVCDDAHGGCATSSQIAACTGQGQEAACSYPGVSEGACYEGVCLPSGCGNGVMASGEVCDDGNRLHGDGCSADCRSTEACGNGLIDEITGEQCDDANLVDGDTCQSTCRSPRCGDGIQDVAVNEACDMGAANSNAANAACRTNCQLKRCGDGVHDSDEVCEDGNVVFGDGCSGDCKSLETCGSGYLDVAKGEACDPGAAGGSPCRNDCTIPGCGDGVIDTTNGESCDAGASNSNAADAACRTNCQPKRCGDGTKDTGEVCDGGNIVSGDGCSGDCKSLETCGNGYLVINPGRTFPRIRPLATSRQTPPHACVRLSVLRRPHKSLRDSRSAGDRSRTTPAYGQLSARLNVDVAPPKPSTTIWYVRPATAVNVT